MGSATALRNSLDQTNRQKIQYQDKWIDRWRTSLMGYAFILPFLCLYIIFGPYLLLKGGWISFHDWDLSGFLREWSGLANYARMFTDDFFWLSLWNTFVFVVFGVTAMTALALGLALVLNRPGRVFSVMRTIFFCSGVLSVTVIAIIWQKVLTPNAGLVANITSMFGLEPVSFTTERAWATPAVIVASLWWGIGFPIMLFLSGLQQIPHELYEAALIDNASPWSRFWKITLPSLKRTMTIVVLTQSIGHFQIFGQVQMLTRGGPDNSTRTLVQTIYETGWRDWDLGYASSMSMTLFLIMAVISFIQFRITKD